LEEDEEDFETTLNRDDLNLNSTEYFDEDDYVKTNSTEADLNAKFEPVEPSKHNAWSIHSHRDLTVCLFHIGGAYAYIEVIDVDFFILWRYLVFFVWTLF